MSQTSSKSAAALRLQKELGDLLMSDTDGISAYPENDDLFTWIGSVRGVDGTPYESLTFDVRIKFPDNYPYHPPEVTFLTPCFHPNVDKQGAVCLDVLQDKWSAVYSASSVLLSIQSLLNDPNNSSPLNVAAAEMWRNQVEFRKHVLATFRPES